MQVEYTTRDNREFFADNLHTLEPTLCISEGLFDKSGFVKNLWFN